MRKIAGLLLVALMTGCGQTTPSATGPDHPASTDASEAPAPAVSTTLSGRSAPTAATTPSGGHVHGDSTSHTTDSSSQPAATAKYTCPHHPEVVADKAGTCPKCKMKLVKKEAGHEGHH